MRKGTTILFERPALLLILSALVVTACQKTPVQFGQAYVDNSFSNVVLVDTITPELTTVFTDSVITNGSNTVLAGDYTDPYFGRISASSFFELSPPAVPQFSNNAVFDSLKLILIPNKTYYGDTSTNANLSVYQLSNEMNFPEFQTVFYNNTNFAVNASVGGSFNGRIYPNITDSVFVTLPGALGQDIFSQFLQNNLTIQSAANFLPYFKGLRVSSTSGSMSAIYGFKDTATMRLYYHETSTFIDNKKLDFTFYNGDNTQFNRVVSDRTGTPLQIFGGGNSEQPSAATGNSAYLQYLTGFLPKIKFPSLRDLYLRPDFVKILRADLVIKPVNGSYPPELSLPPILYASETDQNNFPGSDLIDATSNFQTGNLELDNLYNQNTQYTYDVTSYLQQQVNIGYSNQNGLLLIPPSPTRINTFNRAVFGDKTNTQGAIQLNLYYVSVNP